MILRALAGRREELFPVRCVETSPWLCRLCSGHSMGAATAALLAALWRKDFPQLHWCVSLCDPLANRGVLPQMRGFAFRRPSGVGIDGSGGCGVCWVQFWIWCVALLIRVLSRVFCHARFRYRYDTFAEGILLYEQDRHVLPPSALAKRWRHMSRAWFSGTTSSRGSHWALPR